MKVKNIAFSGFAAAILMGVCGAAQAADPIRLASQGYVTNQVGAVDAKVATKQDKLTAENGSQSIIINTDENGNLTTIEVDTDYIATNDAVTEAIGDAITGGEEFKEAVDSAIENAVKDGVVGDTIDSKLGAVDENEQPVELTTDEKTVYGAINELQTEVTDAQDDATQALTDAATAQGAAEAAQADVDALSDVVDGKQDKLTDANAGEGISITTDDTGKVTIASTYEYDDSAVTSRLDALEADNTASTALTNANEALEDAAAAATAASTADGKAVAAQERADAAYALAETKQTAQQVTEAIDSKLDNENYISGNGIGEGSYLMFSDGMGGISWSSVVIVDENGDDINMAPGGSDEQPSGV